jgi:hypothetical protein
MYAYAMNFGMTLARNHALCAARWYTAAQAGRGDGAATTNDATANGGEAQVRPACDTALCRARAAALFALTLHEQQQPHTESTLQFAAHTCIVPDDREIEAKLTVSAFA